MANLKNKVVVITGASEGIGRALAREMAPLGCHLVLCARNQARLQSLVEEITALGGMASSFAMDITDKQSCTDLVTLCEVELGRLDIVIYNAGISMWSRFDQLADMDVMERLIRVNYLAPVQLRKVRTSPRTALAYEQKRVRGIQIKEGWLPFKAEYRSNRDCSKAP